MSATTLHIDQRSVDSTVSRRAPEPPLSGTTWDGGQQAHTPRSGDSNKGVAVRITIGFVASAAPEQAATTVEIARSINEASQGSNQIGIDPQSVAATPGSTSGGAKDSQRAATELARTAADLQGLVSRFRY